MNTKASSPVVVISGPTASGKTMMSIELALRIQKDLKTSAQIVNFDSLLFYRELNIGTAKPTIEERREIVHHLIDISPVNSPLNASDYILMAKEKIEELHQNNIIPILVGGSAFYLRALIKGMYGDDHDESDTQKKEQIAHEALELLQKKGIDAIREYLLQNDPESFHQLHENDHYRNTRAYEFHRLTGRKISEEKKKADQALPYDFSTHVHGSWEIYHYYLDIPKPEHWKIIEKRADTMLRDGLIQEVQALLDQGYQMSEKPLRSIGYKEAIEHCLGETTLEQCKEKIVIATRQLAKAQRTFFNKVSPKETFHPLQQKELFLQKAIEDLSKANL